MQIEFSEFSPPQLLPADGLPHEARLAAAQRWGGGPALYVKRVWVGKAGFEMQAVPWRRPRHDYRCFIGWTMLAVAGSRVAYLIERRPLGRVLDPTYSAEIEVYPFRHQAKVPKSWGKKDLALIWEQAVVTMAAVIESRNKEPGDDDHYGPREPLPCLAFSLPRKEA